MASLSIPRRRLGRTELSIPVVPFGTLGFSNQFGFVSDEGRCCPHQTRHQPWC